jgi:hypothetical protein
MRTLEANDIVAGAEGTVTAIIDNRVRELAEVVNITATVDLNKSDLKVLGKRMTQHKVTGASGSGTMNMHYVSSLFGKQIVEYLKTGKVTVFDINIKNQDPASDTGKQVTKLSGCIIDGADLAKLDLDADTLDQEVNFTFTDADYLSEFNELN